MAGRVRDVPSKLREDLSFTGSFDCHISITFQAHTLVSPQGVCARAIFAAAGPNIAKIYQAPTLGEITVTPGYLLACSHVIHTCCSKWDGGNGEVVCAFFYAMLVLYSNNFCKGLNSNDPRYVWIWRSNFFYRYTEALRRLVELQRIRSLYLLWDKNKLIFLVS